MIRLVARRLVGALLVLWAVATLSFFALKATPGGPFDRERQLSPEVKRNIERRYGLDRPVWEQYLDEIGRLARGDLGQSMRRPYSVPHIIPQAFPRPLPLALPP